MKEEKRAKNKGSWTLGAMRLNVASCQETMKPKQRHLMVPDVEEEGEAQLGEVQVLEQPEIATLPNKHPPMHLITMEEERLAYLA